MADYIVINDDLRTMQIPENITLLGVESDDDVNRLAFQMPKTYSGYDLSTFTAHINYINANGDGDVYIVDDLTTAGDTMTFSWLVGRSACAYKGNTRFIVCLKLYASDGSGDVLQEFNTTVYSLPVLEGLETTDAVVQQNPDIIEHILYMIDQAGVIDPDDYYTKSEVDEIIPTRLPNPYALRINGVEYDGSAEQALTISADSDVIQTATGKVIHTVAAVPQAMAGLEIYDANDEQLTDVVVAVTNKNLFRIDQIDHQTVIKNITYTKLDSGAIKCEGMSTDELPNVTCVIDKGAFEVGRTYTLSSGKVAGYVYVRLTLTYADGTVETFKAKNTSVTFTLQKEVTAAEGAVEIANMIYEVNEVVYPMLEIGTYATAFANNIYNTLRFNGITMPSLPADISNLWGNDDRVDHITAQYRENVIKAGVYEYFGENLKGSTVNGSLIAISDGIGTVTLGVG